jgi:Tail-tube assembly protein
MILRLDSRRTIEKPASPKESERRHESDHPGTWMCSESSSVLCNSQARRINSFQQLSMAEDTSNIAYFPSDLRSVTAAGKAFPQIEFTVQGSAADGRMYKSIYLPMPMGITFHDGGDYSKIELGPIGGLGMDAMSNLMRGDISGAYSAAKSSLGQSGLASSIFTKVKAYAAQKVGGMMGSERGADLAMFGMKKINAPNTNTTFTGNNLRSFTFSLKMIARNSNDTNQIRRIHRILRRYTYAGSDSTAPNLVLDYPPIWRIRFIIDGNENQYMPKIFACYLTTLQTTFNASNNTFRYEDGSPYEVDLSITFQETRTLTRRDIDNLEYISSNDPNSNIYRGIGSDGLATSSVPQQIKGSTYY